MKFYHFFHVFRTFLDYITTFLYLKKLSINSRFLIIIYIKFFQFPLAKIKLFKQIKYLILFHVV